MVSLANAARHYARMGWKIIPVQPKGKVPLVKGGVHAATDDLFTVSRWWSQWPNANIGLHCGASRLVALDFDDPDEPLLKELADRAWAINRTASGVHLLFGMGQHNLKCSPGGLPPKVHVRGHGGYIIVPPSVHPSGHIYTWEKEPNFHTTPPEIPEHVVRYITDKKSRAARSVLETCLESVRAAPEGDRNNTLNACAYRLGKLVAAAHLHEPSVRHALRSAALEAGLDEHEIDPTISSGLRAGKRDAAPSEGTAHGAGAPKYPLTDMGNAARLVDKHGDNVRYCHPWKSWLIWDGRRWQKDENGGIMRLCKDVALDLAEEAAINPQNKTLVNWSIRSQNITRLQAMHTVAASDERVVVSPTQLDADHYALNTLSGTVDLRTGRIRPHNKTDLITKLAPFDVADAADAVQWWDFLDRIFDGDLELIAFVQRAVGYAITGDTSEQCLFILYGTGANGKTTFLNVLRTVLGDYASHAPTEMFLKRSSDRIPNDLARLRGSRFVTTAEMPFGARLDETFIKQITGGDTLMARFMHREWFEFRATFKVFSATNHLPAASGGDRALWRRILVIPFTVTIPPDERDPHLEAKLLSEAPAIIGWLIEGCLAWQETGLRPPQRVLDTVQQYRESVDVIGQFLSTCFDEDVTSTVPASTVYKAYQAWCVTNGETPYSARWLGIRLSERGLHRRRTSEGVVYTGIRLKASWERLAAYSAPS